MAIDITLVDHRTKLQRALRQSWTDAAPKRTVRKNLMDIYADEPDDFYSEMARDKEDLGTLLNLFQKFVRGHLLTLAYYSPKWSIEAQTAEARGTDKRVQSFLTRYSEIINFNKLQKQLALDSAFGWAVCKVDNGPAPKGNTTPVVPRAYRINPDQLIVDPTVGDIDECAYIGDMYLVPLNEAQTHPEFIPERAAKLQEFRQNSESSSIYSANGAGNVELYAEPMTRLLDVYIPAKGKIYTYPCPNDEFTMVASEDGLLGERESAINPYCMLNLLEMPGFLVELSRLKSLRGLHLVSNEMLMKGVEQARSSQRNPVGPLGAEQDMSTALNAGDNNPIFLEDKQQLSLYTIPGPDPSILGLGMNTAKLFSSEAGNLEVALGASAGADTARQTEALLGQISASQSLDRRAFEEFLAQIGKKMAELAFANDELEVKTLERVPGTQFQFSRLWAGPTKMPRVCTIDDMSFKVTPYSTAFRTPQEKVSQLNQATQLILQLFMAKGQGAPLDLGAITQEIAEAFDLVPSLLEWWNGQDPTPQEQTNQAYQTTAQKGQGSDVRYQGSQNTAPEQAPAPQEGGGLS